MPTVERVILVPVALFDQRTVPVAQLAVKMMLLGAQTMDCEGVLTVGTVGLAFISNTLAVLASELQPFDTQVAVME